MARRRARRFLAPRGRQGDGLGYLAVPDRECPGPAGVEQHLEVVDLVAARTSIFDEPEAVGPAIVDAYSELARTYDLARHRAEVGELREVRAGLSVGQRIADARHRAKVRHVDVRSELRAVEWLVDRAGRGGRVVPQVALQRLVRVEELLDTRADLEAA